MKVRFAHFRTRVIETTIEYAGVEHRVKLATTVERYYRHTANNFSPECYGGRTECRIYDNDGQFAGYGESVCSIRDNFCYREGRDKALERALEDRKE